MSDTAKPRRIRAQTSPRDPYLMRFILDTPIQAGREAIFDGTGDNPPLARALLEIDGVGKIQVAAETILVTRMPSSDGHALKAPIAEAIRQVLNSTDQPLGDVSPVMSPKESDAALLAAVTDLLDARANPAIASHGGHISAEKVQGGTVYLRMSGGCQGCAASAATLRDGVEQMIRAARPDVVDIIDVTDHAAGTDPYYKSGSRDMTPQKNPLLHRPVPEQEIQRDKGQYLISPDYLARQLSIDAQTLREALRSGEVVSRSETGTGPDTGKTRLIVRSSKRAWAAEITEDGQAYEIPPPRAAETAIASEASLQNRIRAHLNGLPVKDLPITYGQLARAMGLYMPGSIAKVTQALEETMIEDARAGAPFVAALVVSKTSGVSPARGFFDHAHKVGRGAQAGEDDETFHKREFDAAIAAL